MSVSAHKVDVKLKRAPPTMADVSSRMAAPRAVEPVDVATRQDGKSSPSGANAPSIARRKIKAPGEAAPQKRASLEDLFAHGAALGQPSLQELAAQGQNRSRSEDKRLTLE